MFEAFQGHGAEDGYRTTPQRQALPTSLHMISAQSNFVLIRHAASSTSICFTSSCPFRRIYQFHSLHPFYPSLFSSLQVTRETKRWKGSDRHIASALIANDLVSLGRDVALLLLNGHTLQTHRQLRQHIPHFALSIHPNIPAP